MTRSGLLRVQSPYKWDGRLKSKTTFICICTRKVLRCQQCGPARVDGSTFLIHPVTHAWFSGKSGKWTSPFALRAHFPTRSVHVLSIALSRNKYGLFLLNCIQIAFWPATRETPQQSNKCSRDVGGSCHGGHGGLYVHSRIKFMILSFPCVNFIAVWIIRITQLPSTCRLILSFFLFRNEDFAAGWNRNIYATIFRSI